MFSTLHTAINTSNFFPKCNRLLWVSCYICLAYPKTYLSNLQIMCNLKIYRMCDNIQIVACSADHVDWIEWPTDHIKWIMRSADHVVFASHTSQECWIVVNACIFHTTDRAANTTWNCVIHFVWSAKHITHFTWCPECITHSMQSAECVTHSMRSAEHVTHTIWSAKCVTIYRLSCVRWSSDCTTQSTKFVYFLMGRIHC